MLISNQERGYMAHEKLFQAAVGPELFNTAVNVAKLGLAINKRLKKSRGFVPK